MNVSVVLLQHGLCDMTAIALASVQASSIPPHEIIVVDNGSPADDKRIFPDVEMVCLPENIGYVRGTNAGWRMATGDYIALCNNDISLSSGCLEKMALALERNETLGWVSACYQAGGWKNCIAEFRWDALEELHATQGAKRECLNAWANTLPNDPVVERTNVTEATVVMVKRSVSERVGMFWEKLVYFHTHDYALRLRHAGYNMGIVRNALFWHNENHPTLRRVSEDGGEILHAGYKTSVEKMDERWGEIWKTLGGW